MTPPSSIWRPLSRWRCLLQEPLPVFPLRSRHLTTETSIPRRPQYPPLEPLPSRYRVFATRPGEKDDIVLPPRILKTYPPPPSHRAACPEPLKAHTASQLSILDPTGSRQRLFSRTNPDAPKVGDILITRFRTGDPFAGVCMSIRQRGVDTSILLRNQLTRVGAEMWVKIYSPDVTGIEMVERAGQRARRARLYYLRLKKHDRGSVQGIVERWEKGRRLVSGSVGAGTAAANGRRGSQQHGKAKNQGGKKGKK
ncbi:MAG: hypothetical protein MMC33_002424 [Icmadophila ericetorum]|nr:hypothetical protein [Icmadophila ericetorum]